jgi:hypothetical protein
MRRSLRITGWLLVEIGVLVTIGNGEADDRITGGRATDSWLAWTEAHPLPLPENDKAEEQLLGELFAACSFATPHDALLEREVRREYLRLSGFMGNRDHWSRVAPTAFCQEAVVRETDRDPADFVLRTTRSLLMDLSTRASDEHWHACELELASLEAQSATVDVARKLERFALYRRVCHLRRRIAFANPLLDFDAVLFVKRRLAVANHMCDQYFGNFARAGGGLFVLEDPFGSSPRVRNVLAGSQVEDGRLQGKRLEGGSFLQPALSYDAHSVLFAFSECGQATGSASADGSPRDAPWGVEMLERPPWIPETSYHIFRVRVDGTGLRQLTDGPWNDLHPHWLPDGRIVFISERRGGFGRCHGRPVPLFTLHAMDADGRHLVRLSHHEGNEWHPSVDNNGMLVYSRWDYVDRGHNQAHHPWISGPDGRDARAIHGNFKASHDLNPDMELNVAAIPGSRRYVATASAHHWQAYGSLIVIDPRVPDDDALAPLRRLTPDVGFPETAERGTFNYGTAWPLSEYYYLCVYSPDDDRYGIYLLDAFGNRELLYRDPSIGCLGPVPLNPRPVPPVIPASGELARLTDNPAFQEVGDEHAIDPACTGPNTNAVVGLLNVYDSLSRFPEAVKIVALRIVHLLPKSTPLHHEPQIGYGAETSGRAVLGTVPVEDDGSAYFYLPAGQSVYFQALDERGCAVQSMRSAAYVHGGETLICMGCHEPKRRTPVLPATGPPLAFHREPSRIRPEVEGSNPICFPLLVQPILDKHCVACHGQDASEPPDLRRGNWQQHSFLWYDSYRYLRPYAFHFGAARDETRKHQYDRWQPARTVPGAFGARASRLFALLDQGHYGVELSADELRRVTVWLDTNSDFFGAYENTQAQARGEFVLPKLQ